MTKVETISVVTRGADAGGMNGLIRGVAHAAPSNLYVSATDTTPEAGA